MKTLRDLRPCDACGGPHHGVFYVVRFSIAVVNRDAVNQFAGMHQFFGGRASMALVENFVPLASQAIRVAMDDSDPEIRSVMTELVICHQCYLEPLDLPVLAERRHALEAAAAATPTTP